jgi:hypothetical protein
MTERDSVDLLNDGLSGLAVNPSSSSRKWVTICGSVGILAGLEEKEEEKEEEEEEAVAEQDDNLGYDTHSELNDTE